MIKIKINKKAFKNKVILNDTSLTINESEIIAIKGESGIGKSTLLKMIGLLEDFQGTIYVNGIEITKKNINKIRCEYFSYMFQKPSLLPYLNVKENLLLGAKNLKQKVCEENYKQVLEVLNIKDIEARNVSNLSGGEACRVALGRAVLSGKKILLCDEPTASLDEKNAKSVMDLLVMIKEKYNLTMIVVTHSNQYDSLFDSIYRIEEEKIIKC